MADPEAGRGVTKLFSEKEAGRRPSAVLFMEAVGVGQL